MRARLFVAVVAVVAVVVPVTAQEFFHRNGLLMHASMGTNACRPHGFDVPPLGGDAWNVRAAVAFAPPTALLDLTFYSADETFGEMVGTGGHLEVTARLPRGPTRRLYVCVGPGANNGVDVIYSIHAGLAGNTDHRVPSAGDYADFDDELYREIIFNAHDSPEGQYSRTSRVLRNPSPQFYIRLGGPDECERALRVPFYVLHYWRMVVPIIAEQLTGIPYYYRVETGCENRPDRPGWVTVHYTTADEYEAETGREWGAATVARARLGASRGRIWIWWSPAWNGTFGNQHRGVIAHEIGHAFGLHHIGRDDSLSIMTRGPSRHDNAKVDVFLFTPAEELSARRAYAAGRGARYCGDPARCGTGNPRGFRPVEEWEDVIVIAD